MTFTSVPYSGDGTEAVLAWATDGGHVFAGTDRGQVLVEDDGGWRQWTTIPAGIRSLVFEGPGEGSGG